MTRQKITTHYLLKKLALKSGEDKLRIAFRLSSFVNKIKAVGKTYGAKQQPRATA